MSTSILILITDSKSKGRLEIDGRLDLLGHFLNALSGREEKQQLGLPPRVTPPPDITLPAENLKQAIGRIHVTG